MFVLYAYLAVILATTTHFVFSFSQDCFVKFIAYFGVFVCSHVYIKLQCMCVCVCICSYNVFVQYFYSIFITGIIFS